MLYVKRTASCVDDMADGADLVTWTATGAMDIAAAATQVAYTRAAYIVALESVQEYEASATRWRTEEAEMACNALTIKDGSSHKLLAEPMFESICAAMGEAEKSWNSVADFEAARSNQDGSRDEEREGSQ